MGERLDQSSILKNRVREMYFTNLFFSDTEAVALIRGTLYVQYVQTKTDEIKAIPESKKMDLIQKEIFIEFQCKEDFVFNLFSI